MNKEKIKNELKRLIDHASVIAPSIIHFEEDHTYGRVTDEDFDFDSFISWKMEAKSIINNLSNRNSELFSDLFKEYIKFEEESKRWHSKSIFIHKVCQLLIGAFTLIDSPLNDLPMAHSAVQSKSSKVNPVTIIENLCNRFHLVSRQLLSRRENRETLKIVDEYDVQDLMHSLLKIFYNDIRPEEWTPSYAGGSSRMDILLPNEKIVIEVKKTRKNLEDKQIGEQLIIDIERYLSHPNCQTLICFVYDPENRISNPRGLEKDLMAKNRDIRVIIYIRPL